jgi:DNA-binding PadR family transcriptional regulator
VIDITLNYGQIYPELKRLSGAGLIESHDEPAR